MFQRPRPSSSRNQEAIRLPATCVAGNLSRSGETSAQDQQLSEHRTLVRNPLWARELAQNAAMRRSVLACAWSELSFCAAT